MGIKVVLVALVAAGVAPAQQSPRFDVATVKPSPPPAGDSYSINLGTIRNRRVELTNTTLSDCLKFAYGLVSDDLISGPDWIKSKAVRFDIVAQTAAATPRETVLLMTQVLLAERLKVVLHHEAKELRYLALTQGKNGPTMKPADLTQPRDNSGGNGHLTGKQVTMLLLATMLSRFEHEVVIDQTGLKGAYEINLTWTPETTAPTVAAANDGATGVSLFTGLQEQLGLRLESRKGPVDVLVVDSAGKIPAEN